MVHTTEINWSARPLGSPPGLPRERLAEAFVGFESLCSILDNLPLLVATVGSDGNIGFLNVAAVQFLGESSGRVTTRELLRPFSRDDTAHLRSALSAVCAHERFEELTVSARRADGRMRRLRLSLAPHRVADAAPCGVMIAGQDVTEAEENAELLMFLAEHDALTGLPNRRVLDAEFESRLAGVAEGTITAVLFVDVDRFKSVNDSYGHDTGDATLVNLATLLVREIGSQGMVTRLCGDEFAVLAEVDGENELHDLAEGIRSAVARARLVPGVPEHRLTVSIGAHLVPDIPDARRALRVADSAMYDAKSQGRDCAVIARVDGADPPKPPRETPVLMYSPSYSLVTGELRCCSAFTLDDSCDRAEDSNEMSWIQPPRPKRQQFTLRTADIVLDEMERNDVHCSISLCLADVMDPLTFERIERAAEEKGVDPGRLEFCVSMGQIHVGGLSAAFLKAASSSPIGLRLNADGAGPAEVLAVCTPPVLGVDIPMFMLERADRGAEHQVRSLFTVLQECGLAVTVTGLNRATSVRVAIDLGADFGEGLALGPRSLGLASVARTIDVLDISREGESE